MHQVKVLPAYYAVPDQSITAFCNLLIGLSRWTGFRLACRTAEWPRQKQAGQAPSGNRGAARQILAFQAGKLNEETRNQETEAVKSYGGFWPKPTIRHPWPGQRFSVKTGTQGRRRMR